MEFAASTVTRTATVERRLSISARSLLGYAAAAFAGLALVAGAYVSAARFPAPLTLDPVSGRVVDVAIGSYVWTLGVRPGRPYETFDAADGGSSFRVALSDDLGVGFPVVTRVPALEGLAIALLLAVAALLASRIGIPGRNVTLGLAAAAALGPYPPVIGFPTALPVMAVPVLITGLAMASGSGGALPSRSLFAGVAAGGALVLVTFVATVTPSVEWPWSTLWLMPAVVVVALGLISPTAAIVSRLASPGPLGRRVTLALRDVVPIARSSHLQGSTEERSRLSAELHNSVLPELAQAILEIDANDGAGRARLDRMAARLRDSLSARQTAILGQLGLAGAIDSYCAGLRPPIPIRVSAAGSSFRPPTDVETVAYRIAQLAVGNALLHSGADAVSVAIDSTARAVALTVSDDGVGIDEEARRSAIRRGRIGLLEMRQLAAAVGGDLAVRTSPETGTAVRFAWLR